MKIFISIVLLLSLSTSLSAYYKKGMQKWKRMCIECHGSPIRGARMYTQSEWEDIRDSSQTPILELHKDDKESFSILEKKMTKKSSKYLFEFLIGNAKDSGVVPGCDSNYCGP